jgi:transcriptional regulator with XRE-family HTH domain
LNAKTKDTIDRSSSPPELERFCDRFNHALNGQSIYAFSKTNGFNESLIRKYAHGAVVPRIERIEELARALSVDLAWLASGHGGIPGDTKPYPEKIKKEPLQGRDRAVYLPKPTPNTADAWQDFELIPFYDIEISAGHGSFAQEEFITSHMAFRKDWLQQR